MRSSNIKYIGLDVHKEAISIAVLNEAGKLVMESIIETKASTLVQFLDGLRGELHVTFLVWLGLVVLLLIVLGVVMLLSRLSAAKEAQEILDEADAYLRHTSGSRY